MPLTVEPLTTDNMWDYVELFILSKLLCTKGTTAKKIIALDERKDVVGLMSYRLNDRGIKRINTLVFNKGKGVGTAMVKHLCQLYPDRAQYSINIPSAHAWVKKMGMNPGKIFPDGKQEFHWSQEEVANFGRSGSEVEVKAFADKP